MGEAINRLQDARRSIGLHVESFCKLKKVGTGVKGILPECLRLEIIGEEIQRGRAFFGQVQFRTQEIVGRAHHKITERCGNEREVLEVSVTVSDGIVEYDESEQLFDLKGVSAAIPF